MEQLHVNSDAALSSSPSNQDNKKFEEEVAKAMKISKEELKKGDKEEL